MGVPVRFTTQQWAKYSSLQFTADCFAAMSNCFENHQPLTNFHLRYAPFIKNSNQMASSVDRNRKFFKRIRSLNSSSIQGIIQAFQLTGLLRWQKLPWFFQHFLLDLWLSQFNSAFAVSFHFSERRSSHVSQWFSWTNHNSLLRITTNEIASFCIENRLRQMDFYVFAKLGKGSFWIKMKDFEIKML